MPQFAKNGLWSCQKHWFFLQNRLRKIASRPGHSCTQQQQHHISSGCRGGVLVRLLGVLACFCRYVDVRHSHCGINNHWDASVNLPPHSYGVVPWLWIHPIHNKQWRHERDCTTAADCNYLFVEGSFGTWHKIFRRKITSPGCRLNVLNVFDSRNVALLAVKVRSLPVGFCTWLEVLECGQEWCYSSLSSGPCCRQTPAHFPSPDRAQRTRLHRPSCERTVK